MERSEGAMELHQPPILTWIPYEYLMAACARKVAAKEVFGQGYVPKLCSSVLGCHRVSAAILACRGPTASDHARDTSSSSTPCSPKLKPTLTPLKPAGCVHPYAEG